MAARTGRGSKRQRGSVSASRFDIENVPEGYDEQEENKAQFYLEPLDERFLYEVNPIKASRATIQKCLEMYYGRGLGGSNASTPAGAAGTHRFSIPFYPGGDVQALTYMQLELDRRHAGWLLTEVFVIKTGTVQPGDTVRLTKISFDRSLMDRVPAETTSRMIHMRKESREETPVRFGIGIVHEHDFLFSKRGRKLAIDQHRQISYCNSRTMSLMALNALMNTDTHRFDMDMPVQRRGHLNLQGFLEQLTTQFNAWARIQTSRFGYDGLVKENFQFLRDQHGVQGNYVIVPRRADVYVAASSEENHHCLSGRAAGFRRDILEKSDLGISHVRTGIGFKQNKYEKEYDPQFRMVEIGGFATMGYSPYYNASEKPLVDPRSRDVRIFSEVTDSWVHISFREMLLEKSGVFGGDGGIDPNSRFPATAAGSDFLDWLDLLDPNASQRILWEMGGNPATAMAALNKIWGDGVTWAEVATNSAGVVDPGVPVVATWVNDRDAVIDDYTNNGWPDAWNKRYGDMDPSEQAIARHMVACVVAFIGSGATTADTTTAITALNLGTSTGKYNAFVAIGMHQGLMDAFQGWGGTDITNLGLLLDIVGKATFTADGACMMFALVESLDQHDRHFNMTTKGCVDVLLSYGFTIPISIILARPHQTYNMGTMISIAVTDDFGHIIQTGSNTMAQNDAVHKLHMVHYTTHLGVVIEHPEHVVLSHNAFCGGHVTGGGVSCPDSGVQFVKPNERQYENAHDMYVIPVLGSVEKITDAGVMDITGEFPTCITHDNFGGHGCTLDVTNLNARGRPTLMHYNGAGAFARRHRLQANRTKRSVDPQSTRIGENTILHRQSYYVYDETTKGTTKRVTGLDYWQDQVYAGVGAVRGGLKPGVVSPRHECADL